MESNEYRAWLKEPYNEMATVTGINWEGNWVEREPRITVDTWCDLIPLEKVILMKNLHWLDKEGNEMFENDITELEVDGEKRRFIVKEKEIEREVKVLDDFVGDLQKMKLKTIVFEYCGYDLLPCISDEGICDIEKMIIIGNIFDNPELIK